MEPPGSQTPSDAAKREKDQLAAMSSQIVPATPTDHDEAQRLAIEMDDALRLEAAKADIRAEARTARVAAAPSDDPTLTPAQIMQRSRDNFRRTSMTQEPGAVPQGDTDDDLIAPTEKADSPAPSIFPRVTPLAHTPIGGTSTPIADDGPPSTTGSITDLTQSPPQGARTKPTFHELTPTQGMNGARRPPPTPIALTPIRRTGSLPPPSPPETSQDRQCFKEHALQRRARSSVPRRVRLAIDNTGGRLDPDDDRQIVPFDKGDSGSDSKNYY